MLLRFSDIANKNERKSLLFLFYYLTPFLIYFFFSHVSKYNDMEKKGAETKYYRDNSSSNNAPMIPLMARKKNG